MSPTQYDILAKEKFKFFPWKCKYTSGFILQQYKFSSTISTTIIKNSRSSRESLLLLAHCTSDLGSFPLRFRIARWEPPSFPGAHFFQCFFFISNTRNLASALRLTASLLDSTNNISRVYLKEMVAYALAPNFYLSISYNFHDINEI